MSLSIKACRPSTDAGKRIHGYHVHINSQMLLGGEGSSGHIRLAWLVTMTQHAMHTRGLAVHVFADATSAFYFQLLQGLSGVREAGVVHYYYLLHTAHTTCSKTRIEHQTMHGRSIIPPS